jgi:hypothetical protein
VPRRVVTAVPRSDLRPRQKRKADHLHRSIPRRRRSTDFLYRHPQLRALIHGSITEQANATSSAVRALSAPHREQKAHHEEITKLRKALEITQGENLSLRRRLDRYEVPSTGGEPTDTSLRSGSCGCHRQGPCRSFSE